MCKKKKRERERRKKKEKGNKQPQCKNNFLLVGCSDFLDFCHPPEVDWYWSFESKKDHKNHNILADFRCLRIILLIVQAFMKWSPEVNKDLSPKQALNRWKSVLSALQTSRNINSFSQTYCIFCMACSLLTHADMDKTVIDKISSNAEPPIIRVECYR